MDANWESKFPMVSVRALERIEGFSDHVPILLKKHEREMSAVYNTRHPAKKAPPPAGTGVSSENQ
jgi:hypothetical protein